MSERSKLIMETIALVRSRKARPDLERICKTMQRNHGVDPKETEKWLDILCEKGIVARRPFKGAVSYRIVADEKVGVAKANARYFRNVRKIAKAITELDPHELGVSFNAIERYVSTHWPLTCSILSLRVRLRSSIRDGIEEGRFLKTLNGAYKLGPSHSGVEEVNEEEATAEDSNDDIADDLLCDYCQLNADKNPFGEPEELLVCDNNGCGNKAHPSCLNYSPELVEQIRADDSWQCIDCKACTICDGTGDPDSLLFCDACDKGYHMTCHTPKLEQMPTGKWMCSLCAVKRENNGVFIVDDDNKIVGAATSTNGTSTVAMTSSGPPTMVQLQRTSQLQKGSPTMSLPLRPKILPIRPRPGNSHFRQPMIALGSPTTTQFRPTISVVQTPQSTMGVMHGQQAMINSPAHSAPLPTQGVAAKANLHGITQSLQISQAKYQQEVGSYLREDILRALPQDVAEWSVSDVCYYIKSHGFPGEAKLFEEQEVDGKALLLMSRNDVLTGLRLKLGPALKLFHLHISKLQSRTEFIGL